MAKASPKKSRQRLHDDLPIEKFAELVGASVPAVEIWRSKGMPVEVEKPTGRRGRPRIRINLAKATNWMIAHKVGGFGVAQVDAGVHVDKETISDEPGLAGALQRAHAAERLSFNLVRTAILSKDNMAVRATMENWHGMAKTLSDLEKRHSQRDVIEREIHEKTQDAVREWCEPKRAFVESITNAFASRLLNLKKLSAVEAVLAELKKQLFKQLSEPLKLTAQPKENK